VSNPYGYPAQPAPAGYPAPEKRPNGATAILAGLLGLGLAGVLGYLPVRYFIDMPSGFGLSDLPGKLLTVLALYSAAGIFLLIGALITFFRASAGAVLLLIGALLAIASVLLEPALLYQNDYANYFQAIYEFRLRAAFVRVGGLIGGPLVFVLAVLPPTFRYLRYRPGETPVYGPSAGYPPQGW
jgi:hypothetical protein